MIPVVVNTRGERICMFYVANSISIFTDLRLLGRRKELIWGEGVLCRVWLDAVSIFFRSSSYNLNLSERNKKKKGKTR